MPNSDDELLSQLVNVRNLMVLLLTRLEVKGGEIAKALGVSEGRLSQMLNPRKYKGHSRKKTNKRKRKARVQS